MVFRDTGCGISPENQKRLFSNFGKVQESQQYNKEGVGLGLSICLEIIRSYGGSVNIKSELGKGTDFIINIKTPCKIDEVKLRLVEEKILEQGFDSADASESESLNESSDSVDHDSSYEI